MPFCSMKILLATMLCSVLFLLITSCSANNKNSSDKSIPQQTSSHGLGIPDIPGNPGSAGPAGATGSPGNNGPEGAMGPRGQKGEEGTRGRQGPRGPKRSTRAAGPRGNKGDVGPPGPKGPQGPSGSAGIKGDTGAHGFQGPPAPKGTPGLFVRNWKQCVFKDLSDGKDSGLIKECIFKKMCDNTGLQVYWSGQLRINNCNHCCRRWYFTFNGVECSAPAAIDAVVFMQYGKGNRLDNLHRPRHVEGVCEKIHKGNVRVGFWVGNCKGYGSADAATGWNLVSRMYVEEIPAPQA